MATASKYTIKFTVLMQASSFVFKDMSLCLLRSAIHGDVNDHTENTHTHTHTHTRVTYYDRCLFAFKLYI
jgi:hypothetical protein